MGKLSERLKKAQNPKETPKKAAEPQKNAEQAPHEKFVDEMRRLWEAREAVQRAETQRRIDGLAKQQRAAARRSMWQDPIFSTAAPNGRTYREALQGAARNYLSVNEMRATASGGPVEGDARGMPDFVNLRLLYEDDLIVLSLLDMLEDLLA